MKVLVIGGTGMVGSEVVRALRRRQAEVRVMTRAPETVRAPQEGAEYVAGDLQQPDSIPQAFRDVKKLFLLTPLSPSETAEGLAAVQAAERAGVEHLVFQSIHDVERAPHIPHFKTKLEITERLRSSGIPWTLVSPNNFFQNDFWFRRPLCELGVYPQPYGSVGMSRIDVRDIAEAAAIALTEEGHEGKTYPLAGPNLLTGEGTAEIWGRYLGREVRYAGDDLDAWAVQAREMMPGWLVEDLKVMYAFFQQSGLRASEQDLASLTALLGRPPRSFEEFVAETVDAWTRAEG